MQGESGQPTRGAVRVFLSSSALTSPQGVSVLITLMQIAMPLVRRGKYCSNRSIIVLLNVFVEYIVPGTRAK